MCTQKLHNDEFNSKKCKQEKEKVSHPLQIHSVTKYLLSRTCRARMHLVPRFCCLTTSVQSTLVRRGGIPKSIGGVSLFTAVVTPLLLPVSPDANTCTQALLPALSPLVAQKPSSTSFFTIKPRDRARDNSILLYNRPFRAQCVEVQCPEETALDDLSDCRATDWGSGLQKQNQHFVNLLWCWLVQLPQGSNFRRLMQILPKASESPRFMSGRIQVASCPVTLRLSLVGVQE